MDQVFLVSPGAVSKNSTQAFCVILPLSVAYAYFLA